MLFYSFSIESAVVDQTAGLLIQQKETPTASLFILSP